MKNVMTLKPEKSYLYLNHSIFSEPVVIFHDQNLVESFAKLTIVTQHALRRQLLVFFISKVSEKSAL